MTVAGMHFRNGSPLGGCAPGGVRLRLPRCDQWGRREARSLSKEATLSVVMARRVLRPWPMLTTLPTLATRSMLTTRPALTTLQILTTRPALTAQPALTTRPACDSSHDVRVVDNTLPPLPAGEGWGGGKSEAVLLVLAPAFLFARFDLSFASPLCVSALAGISPTQAFDLLTGLGPHPASRADANDSPPPQPSPASRGGRQTSRRKRCTDNAEPDTARIADRNVNLNPGPISFASKAAALALCAPVHPRSPQ